MTISVRRLRRGAGHGRLPELWRPVLVLLAAALRKLDPRVQLTNPVLLLVWCGAALTTAVAIAEPFVGGPTMSGGGRLPSSFSWAVASWLWLTVLFANVAESAAEARGRTQTATLRRMPDGTMTRRVENYDPKTDAAATHAAPTDVSSAELRPGDVVIVAAGEVVPGDGEIVWGIASVDESAITGESAPVIRAAGGDRSALTGGTRVVSDRIVVRITAPRGRTLVDHMIDLAEGARRQKTPNELALSTLLASLSLSFVIMALTLNAIASPVTHAVPITVLVALLTCLLPTTIAALLSVTGIAAMYGLLRRNVLLTSARALEPAGEVTTVLLDKTGTITRGNRRATRFISLAGATDDEFRHAAVLASLGDPTPEGVSTIELARREGIDAPAVPADPGQAVPFSAKTRMSGRNMPDGTRLRKGAQSAVLAWLKETGTQQTRRVVTQLTEQTSAIARSGGTPLVVAVKPAAGPGRILGVIHLKDVVKDGVPARLARLRALGIRTVMVTGDNPLTAAAIAQEAGVDDYLGDATPEDKLALIRREQAAGHFVAMSGDGINDAPALAQADVGVAMNTATMAAKEAATMVVLDDDPTRLIEIVQIGRKQMATRGALTTFSIANDLVKYIAIVPALFVGVFPGLAALNLMRLHSPASAVLSTVIFNAVVIGVLIPLAMLGVPYRMANLSAALSRNLLIYGFGGIAVPLVGIKIIDVLVGLLPGY
ncbi:potassium-transporting ATPase subunit KdpB [Rhizomonospora bruguierae]|uniref:potassium-transporting ATPase subunit KdpB n=1 Tax=Rhizomonospora bruguierae TaxID=1581705 RepID=UPI001BD03B36|nr:potassium-transporting ATPase subunit KdpB [Micromonospora sp. NBRC 107566]